MDASNRTTSTSVSSQCKERVMLSLIQAAGGNPALVDGFKAMIWQAYSEADFPFGVTEEGMCLWWEHQQQAADR